MLFSKTSGIWAAAVRMLALRLAQQGIAGRAKRKIFRLVYQRIGRGIAVVRADLAPRDVSAAGHGAGIDIIAIGIVHAPQIEVDLMAGERSRLGEQGVFTYTTQGDVQADL